MAVRAISILVHMDLFLSHWTKTGPRWTKTCPGFNQKVLNFISIISPRIQSYYLQKCCEIFFFIFKCYGTFFEGFIETNLNPGPKHVQGGPKTVQRNMTLDQNMSLWVKTCPDCLKNSPGSIPYFGIHLLWNASYRQAKTQRVQFHSFHPPWNTLKTLLQNLWNALETSLKHPLNSVKHLWNPLNTPLKHPSIFLEA